MTLEPNFILFLNQVLRKECAKHATALVIFMEKSNKGSCMPYGQNLTVCLAAQLTALTTVNKLPRESMAIQNEI